MRDLAAAADRIDYWIRRHVIVSCYGTHPPSQSKLNSARDRRVGLSAIGQCLKDQYDALATPVPPASRFTRQATRNAGTGIGRSARHRPARRDRLDPIETGRLARNPRRTGGTRGGRRRCPWGPLAHQGWEQGGVPCNKECTGWTTIP